MPDFDVQLLLADLALIIILARLLGMAAKRIGQPPVLGEIVAGILLGPTIWGTKITATLFPPTLRWRRAWPSARSCSRCCSARVSGCG